MDFTTNYCGMYWSDGTFQSSVSDGTSLPVNVLDAECQRHDASYKKAKTTQDLSIADEIFYNRTRDLGIRGRLYGGLVRYGNRAARFVGGEHPRLRGSLPERAVADLAGQTEITVKPVHHERATSEPKRQERLVPTDDTNFDKRTLTPIVLDRLPVPHHNRRAAARNNRNRRKPNNKKEKQKYRAQLLAALSSLRK